MPTVPIIAPPLAELDAEERHRKVTCGAAQPDRRQHARPLCHFAAPPSSRRRPVGLMLIGEHGGRRLFAIAAGSKDRRRAGRVMADFLFKLARPALPPIPNVPTG
jgi:hypothetical protein